MTYNETWPPDQFRKVERLYNFWRDPKTPALIDHLIKNRLTPRRQRRLVYLLHVEERCGFVWHYIGATTNANRRITEHAGKTGAQATKRALTRGATIHHAATFNAPAWAEQAFQHTFEGFKKALCVHCQTPSLTERLPNIVTRRHADAELPHRGHIRPHGDLIRTLDPWAGRDPKDRLRSEYAGLILYGLQEAFDYQSEFRRLLANNKLEQAAHLIAKIKGPRG